jgi:hypothetical protein
MPDIGAGDLQHEQISSGALGGKAEAIAGQGLQRRFEVELDVSRHFRHCARRIQTGEPAGASGNVQGTKAKVIQQKFRQAHGIEDVTESQSQSTQP